MAFDSFEMLMFWRRKWMNRRMKWQDEHDPVVKERLRRKLLEAEGEVRYFS
ncbi:MAG TPA: hypothetical protein VJ327_03195 [Patescibacteria group bacterium]|nr:hypothetical protein [Patescibacteria group bacterium]